ncbi:MAG TPA: hypothetical protein VFN54_03085 [Acidimicrobiales bacterium]|nr:hypothetical protein [Acidimicrobiales bacterium]
MARERADLGRRLFRILTVAAVGETVWTVYLGWRLPHTYVAENWDAAWVGLDVAQVLSLLACAWAAWRHRAILTVYATLAATLLLVDAWFDLTTARRGDFDTSLITLIIELPSAAALLWIARRALIAFAGHTGTTRVHRIALPAHRPRSGSPE